MSKGCQQVFYNSNGSPCGSPTEIWGYGGTWPGPTFAVKKGKSVIVTHTNQLGQDYEAHDIDMTVHHHGLKINDGDDGHPQPDQVCRGEGEGSEGERRERKKNTTPLRTACSHPNLWQAGNLGLPAAAMIEPGSSYSYNIPNNQEPGTHWYHDHKMHDTGEGGWGGGTNPSLAHQFHAPQPHQDATSSWAWLASICSSPTAPRNVSTELPGGCICSLIQRAHTHPSPPLHHPTPNQTTMSSLALACPLASTRLAWPCRIASSGETNLTTR